MGQNLYFIYLFCICLAYVDYIIVQDANIHYIGIFKT